MSLKQIIFVGYLAMLVLEVMKSPTKQQSRHCRYNHRILCFLTHILNLQLINTFLNKPQLVWNTAVDNKLHSIKSILGEWRPAFRADRKEVVLARLRIGHGFITHSYLLKGEEQPTCVPCDTSFTIKHIYCTALIFKTHLINEIHTIFDYLKEISLFNKN